MQILDAPPVPSGFDVDLLLEIERVGFHRTVPVIRLFASHGVSLSDARDKVESLIEQGSLRIILKTASLAELIAALTDLGVWVRSAAAPPIAETKEFLSVA
ncbi:MAG: hypothetical protein ACOVVK_20830 [Elsteraceae bacterium]